MSLHPIMAQALAPFAPPEFLNPNGSHWAPLDETEKVEEATAVSRRDFFAAHAMHALLSKIPHGIKPQDCIECAEDSFLIADAMIGAGK